MNVYLLNELNRLEKLTNEVTDKVKAYVQDISIPLDNRWELFIKSDLGEEIRFVEDFGPLGNVYEYYDFFFDRNQTVDLASFIANIEEGVYSIKITKEEINIIKEEILGKFIKSFIYDW